MASETTTHQAVPQTAVAEAATTPATVLLAPDRRICGSCREEKPLAEFTKSQRAKGEAGRCRCCVAASLATEVGAAPVEGGLDRVAPTVIRTDLVAAPPPRAPPVPAAAHSMGAHLPSVFASMHHPTFFSKATGAMINVLAFALSQW